MTAAIAPPALLAGFRGPVACRGTANGLTLTGAAADAADETLILTLVGTVPPGIPGTLSAVTVLALDGGRCRIAAAAQDWVVAVTSVHVHRDIGVEFRRAIPPRPVPLAKRVMWRIIMALAGTRAGMRLLLALRRR